MSSVETVSALERRLNASIPQQAIRGEVAARLKKIGRSAKIAGFRPGKAPIKILEQHYGAQAHQEALGDALQRSFAEAVETNNLNVAGYPQFEIKTNDLNADQIEYSATFEVYPEVVLGDLSGETVERLTYEVTQTDVDNTIATLRKQRATFEAVTRAAQNDDRTMIDFVGKLNGEVFQGGEGKNYPVTLGSGSMLPEFEAAIVGMKAGDTKSFDLTFPESYHSKELAGKQVTFTITLHGVEAPRLPELDAEFAKTVGIADGDVSKLEDEIRSNLTREVSRRLKVRNKGAAMDALLRVARFEVPKALLEWESQSLMKQTIQDMESRGMKMKGMALPPSLFTERAERRVKLGLIMADLLQKHDLKAMPEQTKALIMDYAQSYDDPEQVIRWYAADPNRKLEVENLILEENVVAWVMGQAKVADKPVAFNDLMGNA
ncbi:MAG: trigger factor [Gallionellales bacterium RIFCSPLOWO2_12_FULL_57_18]|nr:MAG: trigger factor [Gallionellales bacterium RIFCSPLOWO2_02_FULL_57_47]OGS94491.1 MAG: trigger factor [Gallionellales bacterium RIFCSPLOWO2_12_FULL_57_18]